MAEIFDGIENFTDRVRLLIGADKDILPDENILSYEVSGLAEIEVKSAVPLWADILAGDNEENKNILFSCGVYQTAIILIPNVKKNYIKLQQTTHAKVEYFETNINEFLDALIIRLQYLYALLNGEEFIFTEFTISNETSRYSGGLFP